MTSLRPILSLALVASVGACATPGTYPSLAQRDAERVAGTFAPDSGEVAPAPPVAPSADLVARLAELRRQASQMHTEFMAATPFAERLARAAGGTGSDSWAAAQVALADLDSLRSQAAVSLAELDVLWVDATIEEGAPRDEIGTARDAVQAMIEAEDQALARLRGRL